MSAGRRQHERRDPGDLLQTFVAGDVAIAVVVGFEEIHIEHDERQHSLRVAGRHAHLAGEMGVEETFVGQFGQSIVQGLLFKRLVRKAQLCGQSCELGLLFRRLAKQHDQQPARRHESVEPAAVPADIITVCIEGGG